MLSRYVIRSRAVLVAAALVVALALFLAACGGDKGGSSGGGDQGTPKPGGTYNWPIRSEPLSIEPMNIQEVEANEVTHQVFQGLYRIEMQGDTGVSVPDLAEKTEVNEDSTVFTFTIKKGVTFAPPVNREVKAQDFVDSWSRLADPKNKAYPVYFIAPIEGIDPSIGGYSGKDGLTGAKALDDYTLQVTLRYPYPEFTQALSGSTTYVTPVDYINKIGAKAYAEKPVGTGPYMVDKWVHRQKITLVKNPNYWDKANAGYVDVINMPIIEDENTEWLEFQKGNIDFTAVPVGQVRASQNMPQVKSGEWTAKKYPTTGIYFIGINMGGKGILAGADKLPIRQALNYAADRDAVVNVVNEGVNVPTDGIVPPTMPGYKAGLNPYPYDPAKGKQVIDEYVKANGAVPTLPYEFNTGAGHDKIAEAMAAGWEKNLGIKVALTGVDTNAFWTDLPENKVLGLFRYGWGADYPSIDNFIYLFTTEGKVYGSSTFYSNPQVDALYEKARSTVDETERNELYNEAEKTILTDAPCVPLYAYEDYRVTNNRIGGFNFSAYETVDMWKVWVK